MEHARLSLRVSISKQTSGGVKQADDAGSLNTNGGTGGSLAVKTFRSGSARGTRGSRTFRISLPRHSRLAPSACLTPSAGSAQPEPASVFVYRARLCEHSRFWASNACASARALSRPPVGAVGLRWCSLLFAVDAGCTGRLSANLGLRRTTGHSRLAHALAPCCAATRRLCEAHAAEQGCLRLWRPSWRPSTLAAPPTLARRPTTLLSCAALHTLRSWSGSLIAQRTTYPRLCDSCSPTASLQTVSTLKMTTLLHTAAQRGSIDVLRLLLEAGANANSTDSIVGITPLSCAIGYGHLACARELIAHTDLRLCGAYGKMHTAQTALETRRWWTQSSMAV